MKSKNKNSRVPKSGKTRLSDLTPKKDARGGVQRYGGPPWDESCKAWNQNNIELTIARYAFFVNSLLLRSSCTRPAGHEHTGGSRVLTKVCSKLTQRTQKWARAASTWT